MTESLWQFRAESSATVYVDITNPDVIERVTGPGGDDWRSAYYGSIKTAKDVIAHFAYNLIVNGVDDVSRLDGWGDVKPGDVVLTLDSVESDVQEWS